VLLVEGSTHAVVLAALDSNPHALIASKPLIPMGRALALQCCGTITTTSADSVSWGKNDATT
jgi:hypothetical protein